MSGLKTKLPGLQLVGIVVFLGLMLGASSWSLDRFNRAEKSARTLLVKQREWAALTRVTPALVPDITAELEAQAGRIEAKLRTARKRLGGGSDDPIRESEVPAQRAEAFFAIAQFVEAQRGLAQAAGVSVPDGTQFGFSAYSNSGPETELIGVVHRQQRVMSQLLGALWGAKPKSVTRTLREIPAVAGAKVGGSGTRTSGRNNDFLRPASGRSLRRAGLVDTLTFQIGFVGKTNTLRRFLQNLEGTSVALVVRGIEVEPVSGDGSTSGGVRSLADLFRDDPEVSSEIAPESEAVPIIESNLSEFLVTVSYLDFEGARMVEASEPEGGE